ncbi:MAG: DNA polymerase IV [Schleiferiaceae bacterium]|nr:DNA polymerase IV [Schleiferiaceae bacterium]
METRSVVHMDLDTFFVSVERLLNSALVGRPVLIGGASGRSVVASCSYEARQFGIHSAMPMKLARRLCPEAIIVRGDFEQYSKFSRLVTDIIKDNVPVYEKSSIDEFYLDLTGMDRFFGCFQYAKELRQRIIKESGLPISLGISQNKTVSKVATGEAKPAGQLKIDVGSERAFLAPLSVRKIPMIGKETGKTLSEMGVQKVLTLQQIPPEILQRVFGKPGIDMWRKAHGIDNTPVKPYSEQKSLSAETTFDHDTIDTALLHAVLVGLTEKLAAKLRYKNKLTSVVTVKLRYSNFQTFTRQMRVSYTAADHHLLPVVKQLFDRLYERRMLIRLVGVSFGGLVSGSHQIHLFDDTEERIRLYQAMDHLNQRWGKHLVHRAVSIRTASVEKSAPKGSSPPPSY